MLGRTQEKYQKYSRAVLPNGKVNAGFSNIPKRSLRFCQDLVTTLIEQKWCYTIFLFVSSFFLIWFFFTLLWYLIVYSHGDLFFDITGKRLGDDKNPCVFGVRSFIDLFIYTVETQVSIGFGEKYPSEECPEGVFVLVMQLIISIAIEGALVGIIYAKISRPAKQISQLKFSKIGLISHRDGKLCLMFRVCDFRGEQSIGTQIRLYMLKNKRTLEDENLVKYYIELKTEGNGKDILFLPAIVCHIIDETSPLYMYSKERMQNENLEFMLSLVGGSPSSGQITESKTSYLADEILWSHYFKNIIHYDNDIHSYRVDYNQFHSTFTTITSDFCDDDPPKKLFSDS